MYLAGEYPWEVRMLRKEDFAVIRALKKRDVYMDDIAAELGVHRKTVSRVLPRGSAPLALPPVAQNQEVGVGSQQGQVDLHHDQDTVFTDYTRTSQLLLKNHVRVSCALHGARYYPQMEAFNSRFKTESRSLLLDAHTLASLRSVVAERMAYYNRVRRHSSIGYRAPASYVATLQPWS